MKKLIFEYFVNQDLHAGLQNRQNVNKASCLDFVFINNTIAFF
jgi:hypothetical protein